MSINDIINRLKDELGEVRVLHSINVMEVSAKLAEKYGVDIEKAKLAGILHDCGKNYRGEKAIKYIEEIGYEADEIELAHTPLLHGVIGQYIAQVEYEITDPEILNAIRWHTTGKAGMTTLEKIIYVADYIEPLRNFDDIDNMRSAAFEDLDKCIVLCADSTIRYILNKGFLLHEKTVETRNHCLRRIKKYI
ncbi:MAG: HD domain-containing protein [Clostridiaceae bacterium]|nr:HD domain-containing protein [Clostridiaceae bacterium]